MRPKDGKIYFTYDSLLQTLQVLFGLLMTFMQESEEATERVLSAVNISADMHRDLSHDSDTYESSSRRSLLVLS